MFFALTDDQQAFGAAVRGYLAERFDLAAVRGVVEDPDGDGNPATLWKAAGEQGWLAVTRARGARRARARPGRGRRSSRVRSARGRRRGRGAAPCSPPRRIRLAARPSRRRPGCPGWPAGGRRRARSRGATARSGPRPSSTGRSPTSSSPPDGLYWSTGRVRHPARLATTAPCGSPTSPRGTRARSSPRPVAADLVPGRGARGRRPGRHRPRGAHPHGRLRPRAQAVRRAGRLVPGDQAHAGRPALRGHHGRARRALRRARRRRRRRRRRRWPSPSPRRRPATRPWRAPAR